MYITLYNGMINLHFAKLISRLSFKKFSETDTGYVANQSIV